MRLLHIHGQEAHHDDAFIVGNHAGLKALREAVDLALAFDTGASEVEAGDGEGYYVIAMRVEADADWNAAGMPYTADHARDNRDNAVFPHHQLDPKKYEALVREAVRRAGRPTPTELAERDTFSRMPQDLPVDVRQRMADTIDNLYAPGRDSV